MREKYSALKEGPINVSYSIDATKNNFGLFIYKKSGKIVGGAYPNHALDVPMGENAANKLQYIIDSFNYKNSGKKRAYEIKLASVVYQNVPNGHSPMLQLMTQSQTNNYLSDLNPRAADAMLEAQRIMRGECFSVTFSVTDVDDVSCYSEYVKNQLRGLLEGKPESAHTDANHNVKNTR